MQKIAKIIAQSGLCSRREAERWIEQCRVEVNGEIVTTPAIRVSDTDKITVDSKVIPQKPEPRLWLYHKPQGLIVSHNDPEGRPTVFEKLPSHLPRVISVGRLDFNSEGLLLLTNDGEFARKMETSDLERVYKVRVYGTPTERTISYIQKGVRIEGITHKAKSVKILPINREERKTNIWLEVILTEGKNREIRKLFEHFGHPVSRIIRTQYGKYKLGSIKKGEGIIGVIKK